jgi:hypothetical protein
MRLIIFFTVFFCLGFEAVAMDIVKTLKVTEQPKPFYHRKMDQAIRVQFSDDVVHQYLKKLSHPCCRN